VTKTSFSRLKNGTQLEPWYTTEYTNLVTLANLTDFKYFFADVNTDSLYESLLGEQGNFVEIGESLYKQIDLKTSKVVLVMRELCYTRVTRPVVGVVEVVEKEANNKVKCSFLCLSIPQYLGNPWDDPCMFMNSQQITHEDDIRIILDEYKLSLRHRKAKPLFEDLFVSGVLITFDFILISFTF